MWKALEKWHTSFFCLLDRGFPELVNSGGGMGGAGTEREAAAASASSKSGSRIEIGPSNRVFPSRI